MKIGIVKHYDAGAGGEGGAVFTVEDLKKELGTIKSALEAQLTKKAADQEKNLDEKLAAANETIEKLKKAQEEKTELDEKTLKEMKEELDITIKAFDKLQTRMKNQSMTFNGQPEAMDFGSQISRALLGKKDEITSGKIVNKSIEDQGLKLKAVQNMTVIGNVNTGVVPNTYRSGIVPQPFENIHLRDIVTVTPSETDSYHFYRHATTGEGAITWQGNENGQKAQFDEDLLEVTVNLDYLAGYLVISKKMLRNFTALSAYLNRWLPEKYYQKEDTKGYQAIIASASGATNLDTGGGMIQAIIRTIGAQKKAKYNVNGIVVDGATWANILTYKTTTGEFTMPIGVVSVRPDGTLMILGIPVYTASWVGGDEALIGDWRYFEIIQSEGLQVGFFEQDGDNVKYNRVTVRVEASVGFAVLDPAAISVLSLESVS